MHTDESAAGSSVRSWVFNYIKTSQTCGGFSSVGCCAYRQWL